MNMFSIILCFSTLFVPHGIIVSHVESLLCNARSQSHRNSFVETEPSISSPRDFLTLYTCTFPKESLLSSSFLKIFFF
jgi:hypothetical protein